MLRIHVDPQISTKRYIRIRIKRFRTPCIHLMYISASPHTKMRVAIFATSLGKRGDLLIFDAFVKNHSTGGGLLGGGGGKEREGVMTRACDALRRGREFALSLRAKDRRI